MGAAIIMCSVEAARRLGVAEDRWVFPQSGTDCHEHTFVSHRDTFARTPAIELGGRRRSNSPASGIDDIAHHRPVLVLPGRGAARRGVARHRPRSRQWSRTGGLPFAGGPWNNYVMHAIATRRDRPARAARTNTAWSGRTAATPPSMRSACTPRRRRPPPFRHEKPQDEIDRLPRRELALPADAAGPATIEAYTVMFSRDGEPEQPLAVVSARRRPAGVGHRRPTPTPPPRCATANGSAPPSPSPPTAPST